MALPVKTLAVWSNPYCAIDHEGRPCGAFAHDVSIPGMAGVYVGATMRATETQPEVTRNIGNTREVLNHAVHDRTWEFSADATEVANVGHYKRGVKDGDLFAADQKTANECGVKFAPLADCLRAAKAVAAARFDAMHGPGTFAGINPEPAKAAK